MKILRKVDKMRVVILFKINERKRDMIILLLIF